MKKHPKEMDLVNEYRQALANGETFASSIDEYANERTKAELNRKFEEFYRAKAERKAEKEKNMPHTYGDIVKTMKKAKADIEKLKGEPERLRKEKEKELNKEFDMLVENGSFSKNERGNFVSQKLEKYLFYSEEYLKAKDDIREATNLYSECLARKEKWEKDNADIIEAEKVRSKREELMQADPETLRALGITPDPSLNPSKKSVDGSKEAGSEDNELIERESALRSIHPYATEDEIRDMARFYRM